MTHDASKPQKLAEGWRFWVGVAFFVLGLVTPLFVPLVAVTDLSGEMKATLSVLLLIGGPELLWLAAAATMGKSGFTYMRGKAFGYAKRLAPPKAVSGTRYRLGLVMFMLPLLAGWLAPYGAHLIPAYGDYRLAIAGAGDLLFLTSLFVLGGEFWDKLKGLFIHGAAVVMPEQPAAKDSSM